jgi:cysteine desulfurase / selenocysteine lyase
MGKHLYHGLAMIYLDNAATSFPKPESVYQALNAFARTNLANPGRAGHKMALAAERALDDGRHLLNQLFHGAAPERFEIGRASCRERG